MLRPVGWLLGTWRGAGSGSYPTVQGFAYEEELRFVPVVGKPGLVEYTQHTWQKVETEGALPFQRRPMHAETGYLRCRGTTHVELLVADPTGIAQVCEGTADLDGHRLELSTTHVGRTLSAKEVKAVQRIYRLCSGSQSPIEVPRLHYEVHMEAVDQRMQKHLEGELEKVVEISPAELNARQDEFTIIDVREKEEYDRGHINGANNLPLGRLIASVGSGSLDIDSLLPRHQVVVYCGKGYRGSLARQEFYRAGVPRSIFNLRGGWEEWRKQQE